MKHLCALFILLIFSSCSNHVAVMQKTVEQASKAADVKGKEDVKEEISDLKSIPQNVEVYSKNIDYASVDGVSAYEAKYFKAWNIEKIDITLDESMWAYKVFNADNSYGENLQPLEQVFFDTILENSNYKAYSSVNKRAISLKELNIRAFPSDKPLLLNPKKAGEGFPFDYLQNSTIAANKPLFISHYSKNKEWVFIVCSFTYGWVKARDVVIIDKKYTDVWQKAKQVFITTEGVSVYTQEGDFLFKTKIGMMFPLVEEKKDSYIVLSVSNYKNSEPLYLKSTISKNIAYQGVLKFNAQNINNVIDEVSKTNYGWGGMYSQRDCSSTLRDFFTPFGLWMPRNSYQQSKLGKVISLENMSDEEKINTIKSNAVAFKTLLYKKGHIVLYVGEFNGKVIVYHNTWAIKTKKDGVEGRFIVGRPIFSTLRVGENLKYHDENALIIKQLKSMSTI